MKTYLDCYPCFLRQALDAARYAGADEEEQRSILHHVLEILRSLDPGSTPPEIGDAIHRLVREKAGEADPYAEAKREATEQALALYPRLKTLVDNASDPLDTALRLSIAGNIIDLAPNRSYDLWQTVERVLKQPFAIDDSREFERALSSADRILYLGDNAGETVFDRVLIEALDRPVIYAVKGGPILNDATMKDAIAAGLDQVAELIATGSDAPGTVLRSCSPKFRRLYDRAQMIVAKGQANYETLSGEGERLFFLLQIKCPVIAQDAGVAVGDIVLKRGSAH
ncbi:MAG TPA: DUF89 family protein [Chloroflexi bacterium]|nr:DUF89 family protein [Chloroflexota bacterium]